MDHGIWLETDPRRLRKIVNARGLLNKEIAFDCGVHPRTVGKWMIKSIKVSPQTVPKLLKCLGVTRDEIAL